MADIVTPEKRSRMMSGIKGKNTKPELIIRSELYKRGFRYRIHMSGLPGKPDIVFPKYKVLIFIQGCFWHGHDCHLFKWPSSRVEFWTVKINGNKAHDAKIFSALAEQKWRILYVWECALKGKKKLPLNKIIDDICEWLPLSEEFHEIKPDA